MSLTPITSKPTPASTPHLPNEIVEQIFSLLERSQLPLVSQLSKTCHDEIYPSLYQKVYIDPFPRESKSDPRISFVAESGEVPAGMEPALAMEGAIYLCLRHLPFLIVPKWSLGTSLPGRFTYITRLCISTHVNDGITCKAYLPLILPNLHTLQCIPRSPGLDLPQVLDVCGASRMCFDEEYLWGTPETHPQCSILSSLHPHQLILGGPHTTLTGDGAGLWSQCRIPASLKELVIFIGQYPLVPGRSFLANLPSTIERLTLVFAPVECEGEWVPSIYHGQEDESEYEDGASVIYIFKQLAKICRGGAKQVEIVGLEHVSAEGMGFPENEEPKALVKEMITMMLVEGGMKTKKARMVLAKVVFLDRGEWDARKMRDQSQLSEAHHTSNIRSLANMSLATPSLSANQTNPRFPPEIVDIITAFTERSQLPTIIRVSKSLHQSLSPQLWRSVIIDALWDDEEVIVANTGQTPKYVYFDVPAFGMDGAIAMPFHHVQRMCIISPLSTLQHPFTYITHLALRVHGRHHCHGHDVCAGIEPLIMPSIRTLQIIPLTGQEDTIPLEACSNSCPLLTNLRPKVVILGGIDTGFTGDAAGLWTSDATFPPPWLEELVIYIGNSAFEFGPSFLDHQSALGRITFVFLPVEPTSKWIPSDYEYEYDYVWSDGSSEGPERFPLWTRLAMVSRDKAEIVEFVGLELIDSDWMGTTVEQGIKELKEAMVDLDVRDGIHYREAEAEAEMVKFMTRDEWEARERVIGMMA